MRKYILPYFLFLFLLVCACPAGMHASNVDVSTVSELVAVATQSATKDFAGETIELKADIDLGGTKWTPIGTKDKPFKGTFKGNGHTIKGLQAFNGTDGLGLFGYVAKEGVIKQVGISGGKLVAPNKRRVGAIAGVCDGIIRECWSMAEVAVAGTVVGGLVGELTVNGQLIDCYHAGLIMNSSDTIGGIVGLNNGGKMTRVYNTGYIKRGMALVGLDKNGQYEACYTDRKMYYQQVGAQGNGVIPMDKTENMFELFEDEDAWFTDASSKHYPILDAFKSTNAAKLSATPVFVSTVSKDTIDHANDLLKNFTVSTANSVKWACRNKNDEEWIRISGAQVKVIRPCTETEVIVDATLGTETRAVYFRPRRLEDFESGAFGTPKKLAKDEVNKEYCFKEEVFISTCIAKHNPASKGWKENPSTNDYYHYRVSLLGINADNDTVWLKDIKDDVTTPDYAMWFKDAVLPTDSAGVFVIRRYANDGHCVTDWKQSEGQFIYRVFPEFDPGEIEDNMAGPIDTFYLTSPVFIDVDTVRSASGGGGPIKYEWLANGKAIANNDTILKNYQIKKSGVYIFTREAKDSAKCCGSNKIATGQFKVVVFDPVDPGQIQRESNTSPKSDTLKFCSPEEAEAHVIKATAATGGSGKYVYQWYRLNAYGDTIKLTGEEAQKKDLDLSTVTDITFKYGKDYTFVRRAKDDTRFTTLDAEEAFTRYQQIIHIRGEVHPGAIPNGTLEDFCAKEGNITINISEEDAATSTDELEYRWLRILDDDTTYVGVQKDLSYIVQPGMFGNTYTYIRLVRNRGCTQWLQSKGKATQYYDHIPVERVTFTVCDTELPYKMQWVDGKTYTFFTDGESQRLSDTRGKCPIDTIFTVSVVQKPAFTFKNEVEWCQESNTFDIEYSKTFGLVDTFRITYSKDLARYMGRNDTTGRITTEGLITIYNVPLIGTGDHYLYLELGYKADTAQDVCFSKSQAMKLNVNLGGYVHSKYDRVLFVDNNAQNGLDVGTADKLEFKSYQWYKNGEKIEGATGQYYHEGGAQLVGEYYVMLTDTTGVQHRSCKVKMPQDGTSSAPQHSVVYPVPVGAGEPLAIECDGEVQIISFTGEIILHTARINGRTTLNAPRAAGMYYVQITAPDETIEIHKLIVR